MNLIDSLNVNINLYSTRAINKTYFNYINLN